MKWFLHCPLWLRALGYLSIVAFYLWGIGFEAGQNQNIFELLSAADRLIASGEFQATRFLLSVSYNGSSWSILGGFITIAAAMSLCWLILALGLDISARMRQPRQTMFHLSIDRNEIRMSP